MRPVIQSYDLKWDANEKKMFESISRKWFMGATRERDENSWLHNPVNKNLVCCTSRWACMEKCSQFSWCYIDNAEYFIQNINTFSLLSYPYSRIEKDCFGPRSAFVINTKKFRNSLEQIHFHSASKYSCIMECSCYLFQRNRKKFRMCWIS